MKKSIIIWGAIKSGKKLITYGKVYLKLIKWLTNNVTVWRNITKSAKSWESVPNHDQVQESVPTVEKVWECPSS